MQPDIGEHDTSYISDDTDHVHNNARASQQHRIITATMHHRALQSAKNETFIEALTNQEQAGPVSPTTTSASHVKLSHCTSFFHAF